MWAGGGGGGRRTKLLDGPDGRGLRDLSTQAGERGGGSVGRDRGGDCTMLLAHIGGGLKACGTWTRRGGRGEGQVQVKGKQGIRTDGMQRMERAYKAPSRPLPPLIIQPGCRRFFSTPTKSGCCASSSSPAALLPSISRSGCCTPPIDPAALSPPTPGHKARHGAHPGLLEVWRDDAAQPAQMDGKVRTGVGGGGG